MQIFDFIYLTYNHLKYFLSEYVEMSATIIISIIISMTSMYLFILWWMTVNEQVPFLTKNMKLFSLFCSNKDSNCANTKGNQIIIATQYNISSFKLFNLFSDHMPEELTHCWVSKHIITRWISASCSVSDFEAGVCCNVDLLFCFFCVFVVVVGPGSIHAHVQNVLLHLRIVF